MAKVSEQEKIEKKELINKAAISVIAIKGYSEATMHDIANEAGLAVGTIYNYFKNKEDLIYSMFEDKWYEYKKGLEKHIEGITDFDKQFRKRFDFSIKFFSESPDYIKIMFSYMTSLITYEQALKEKLIKIRDMIICDVAKELDEGREKKVINFQGSSIVIANLIFGAMQSFLLQKIILSKDINQNDIETFYNFIYNGLKQNI